jgi:hypothetical protein
MNSLVSVVQQAYRGYCYLLARTIAFLLPPRLWYRTAHRICVLHGHLLRAMLVFSSFRDDSRCRIFESWMIQSIVLRLDALGRPFPIPTSHRNLEAVVERQKNGLVLCSVHLPFVSLALRPMVQFGVPPTVVIAGQGAIIDGKFPICGLAESFPGLGAGGVDVLFKARTILRRGGIVATLIDDKPFDPVNRNIFRLIRSVGARLVFFTTELQPDGEIVIEFFSPQDPFCLSDESVLSNLLALQSRVVRILQLPPGYAAIATPQSQEGVSRTQAADLELDSSS